MINLFKNADRYPKAISVSRRGAASIARRVQYRVVPFTESNIQESGGTILVKNSNHPKASPHGWHFLQIATDGNNVHAAIDGGLVLGTRPVGFNVSHKESLSKALAVQIFYFANMYHDL
jgi:hypothetical protein